MVLCVNVFIQSSSVRLANDYSCSCTRIDEWIQVRSVGQRTNHSLESQLTSPVEWVIKWKTTMCTSHCLPDTSICRYKYLSAVLTDRWYQSLTHSLPSTYQITIPLSLSREKQTCLFSSRWCLPEQRCVHYLSSNLCVCARVWVFAAAGRFWTW